MSKLGQNYIVKTGNFGGQPGKYIVNTKTGKVVTSDQGMVQNWLKYGAPPNPKAKGNWSIQNGKWVLNAPTLANPNDIPVGTSQPVTPVGPTTTGGYSTGGGLQYNPPPSGGESAGSSKGGIGGGNQAPGAGNFNPVVTSTGGSYNSGGSENFGGGGSMLNQVTYNEELGLLRDLVERSKGIGSNQSYDLAANRLRERVGQVAKQQKSQFADNFVARGLGASPALYSKDYFGNVDTGEKQAMTEGLLGLQNQQTQNQIAALNMLNSAIGGYQNLNELDFNANAAAAKLLEDARQFNSSLNFQKKESKKNDKYKKKQLQQANNDDLLRLLEGLGFFV